MNTDENGIKVDEFGMVDTAYYVRQGQLARNEYIAQQLSALGHWLKNLTKKRQPKSFNSTRSFGTV
ncbi:hypothetical protein SAMN03080615_00802 [Amphritea atlantica]|uniref:Uncharacterized protein n=1 Tax=Amphritea atlantica TaxID=355243 RepID=A0A1H9EAW1_9GAMM|nr:hypothetical protein [Amphritea atlantica]SEQ22866.1 hypothetical protein SAMN03080615_00802 [Amphritea atlantica]